MPFSSVRLCAPLWLTVLLAVLGSAAVADGDWERWSEHDPKSEAEIDHAAWNAFLDKYVVHDEALDLNRVRYGDVTPEDRSALRAYIGRLEETRISQYGRDVQLAYWLNLYNAVTVGLVLDRYPVETIRDIDRDLFGGGPWERKRIRVEGKELSLDDVEHRILRALWDEELIHYGLNCASVGCPNLRKEAYSGADVYEQLRQNARAYVNSPRGVRFEDDRLIVSSIYEWYRTDFGGGETAVINHLRRFATPERSARLDAAGGIDDYAYNWTLNDAGRD